MKIFSGNKKTHNNERYSFGNCLQMLYKVLSSGHRCYSLSSRTPYNLTEGVSRVRSRHQLLSLKRNRRVALHGSDCEDNSSGGEEEYTQVRNSFFGAIGLFSSNHYTPCDYSF